MIETLRIIAWSSVVLGLAVAVGQWPSSIPDSGTAFFPSLIAFGTGVFWLLTLLVVAEVLGHLRAIRAALVPVAPVVSA